MRSGRSCGERVIAEAMSVPCSAANVPRFFALRKAPSRPICPGWMPNGPQGATTARSSGGDCGTRASADRCVWSRSGRPAVGEPKKPKVCTACRPPAPWPGLMTTGRDTLSKSETITIAAIERSIPALVEARTIIADFHGMIRKKAGASLETWLERACSSPVASFASGVRKDLAAVRAAITSPWSNGQNRRADHEAQAGQAPDVRPRKARSARSQTDRRDMMTVTKFASEPRFNADPHT